MYPLFSRAEKHDAPHLTLVNGEGKGKPEKAKEVTDAIVHVLDEASKIGIRVLVVYITLDTWRKIAVLAASKTK